jgi:hypothetical protein
MQQFKVEAASKKYEAFPDADKSAEPPKPEVKAAFDDLKVQAALLIDYWGHFIVNPEGNSYKTRADVEQKETDWYKFLHDEKSDGIEDWKKSLKPGVSSTPMPSSN